MGNPSSSGVSRPCTGLILDPSDRDSSVGHRDLNEDTPGHTCCRSPYASKSPNRWSLRGSVSRIAGNDRGVEDKTKLPVKMPSGFSNEHALKVALFQDHASFPNQIRPTSFPLRWRNSSPTVIYDQCRSRHQHEFRGLTIADLLQTGFEASFRACARAEIGGNANR